jgi:site-specific DNA recombinase
MPDYIPPPVTLPPGSAVFAYLRDSGGSDQENSVQQQRSEIVDYCSVHGLVLARVYADVAKSGKSTKKRDEFARMIDDATNPALRPAGLLIWNLSRFSRDIDDSAFYRAMLCRLGLTIHSLTDAIPEGLAGRILESVKDFSNADYLKQMSAQIKRGLEANLKNGLSAGGFPPRGYLPESVVIGKHRDGTPRQASRWIPDPELWPFVVLAWHLRAAGKSYREITKATAGRVYKSVNSWVSFFRNESYLGVGKCGELKIPDHHEAAVSLEDWQKVQELCQTNSTRYNGINHPRRIKYPALLAGLAYCSLCGKAMIHHGRSWNHYVCGDRDRKRGASSCPAERIPARPAETAILDAILSRVLTPAFVEELISETQALLTDTGKIGDEIQRKRAALAEAFGPGAARDRLREREMQAAILEGEIKNLEARKKESDIEITPEALALALSAWRGELSGIQTAGDVGALRSFRRVSSPVLNLITNLLKSITVTR